MSTAKSEHLSASLEDYLEAILNLSTNGNAARSKNIAETLAVSKASVTGALRTLAERKLVNYKPYGYATLTEKGSKEAIRVARKHEIIKSFFVDVLGIEKTAAQKAACKAEHVLGAEIAGKLLNFIEFVNSNNQNGHDLAAEFRSFCKTCDNNNKLLSKNTAGQISLSDVPIGKKVRITNLVDTGASLRARLIAMGLIAGTRITIVSDQPPGPFVVNVRGAKIALGRKMAHNILVEQVEVSE